MYKKISQELNKIKNPEKIKVYQWFFKTGPGEYGEGDIFLGLTSDEVKNIAKNYFLAIDFDDIQKLLNSKIHEERACALRILVYKYDKADEKLKKQIYNFYIKNAKKINNWDLVDVSAPNIVGDWHFGKDKKVLYKLAISKNLWEKRISIISTLTFIRNNQFVDTIKIAEILLNDKHDLIHKAVGWMLREMGKRDESLLLKFLEKNCKDMSRTTLRYAIEKLEQNTKKYFLKK